MSAAIPKIAVVLKNDALGWRRSAFLEAGWHPYAPVIGAFLPKLPRHRTDSLTLSNRSQRGCLNRSDEQVARLIRLGANFVPPRGIA